MISLTAEPYVGALPVRFGMSPAEVAAVIGPPASVIPGVFDTTAELRPNIVIGYTEANQVYEVNCHPGATLLLMNHDLFSDRDPISFLRKLDPDPYLWVGLVVFQKLGILVSGFHDGDDSQKSIAMVRKGYWDEYIDDFVRFEER